MNRTFIILIIATIIYSAPAASYSQITEKYLRTTESKDSINLQHNRLSDNARGNMANICTVYKSSYIRPFSIGTQITGYYNSRDYPLSGLYGASLAFYPGYTHSSGERIQGFGEPPYLNQIYFNNIMEYNSTDGYIFFTPGISVFSKSRKFSLDLFQNYSTRIIINGNPQIVPYKLSVHF